MLWLLVALQCCLTPAQVSLDPISFEASELASSVRDYEQRDALQRLSEEALKRSRGRFLRERMSKAGRLIAKIKLAADKVLQAERESSPSSSAKPAARDLAQERLRSLKKEEARSREELQHLKAKLSRASDALEKVKAATAEVKSMISSTSSRTSKGNEKSLEESLESPKMRLRDMVLKLQMDKAVEEKSSKAVATAKALEIKAHNTVLQDLKGMDDLERILAQAPHA